ncbi:tellurite resistance protein-like permease [Aciduliprofundum sp. MAR08-339]|uniref:SLAC1 family transporter n=1 Tax=Aciduliprofundum sp. (strain MAR08-339) TaxID=673860 RepID=UPI0002A4B3B0|nr:tellurite resistance protein-like permease [Aciduliprofundum sp. MAR08-339]
MIEENSKLRCFSPAWFSAVMGTGVFATSTYFLADGNEAMVLLSKVIVSINVLMFIAILIPWVARWIVYPRDALADFQHPLRSNFYVTFGVGMLVLSTNFFIVEKMPEIGLAFWIAGTIEVILDNFLYMFFVFFNRSIKLEHINPSIFIKTTGLFLVLGAGRAAIPYLSDLSLQSINIIFDFTFGVAFFMYIGLQTIWLLRYIISAPLQSSTMPMFWINLGPIGAAITALLSPPISTEFQSIGVFFASLFWGYGVWWFVLSLVTTIYYVKRISLPYKSAWWAFTFPLGAFIVASYYYQQYKNYSLLIYFNWFMYIILAVFWVLTFIFTLHRIITGRMDDCESLKV